MYIDNDLFQRQACPGAELFYRCGSSGFTGCCSINPCSGGCPDTVAAPVSQSIDTPPASTADTPSPSLAPAGFPSSVSLPATTSSPSRTSSSTTPLPVVETTAAAAAASTSTPADAATSSDQTSEGLSRAAIGGLVAGLIVLLQIAILCGFLYWRRKRLRRPKISSPVLLKTGRSVESFSSDGSPVSGLNRNPVNKRAAMNRVTTHFAGKQENWGPYDPTRRQSSFYSTNSAGVSPISDKEPTDSDMDLDFEMAMEEKERERGPSPLASNPVRLAEMDATAASRPVEVESPVEPAFRQTPLPPRDPSSLQSSQRSHSRRQSIQKLARSLSPISEGTDSPRATLQATSKERQMKRYVTDWSQFGPIEMP